MFLYLLLIGCSAAFLLFLRLNPQKKVRKSVPTVAAVLGIILFLGFFFRIFKYGMLIGFILLVVFYFLRKSNANK
ncbi:MAG: hypothetical protein COA38_08055 [Fluviicola sp.]|nr:MAG: hypothetical protein COA38_08055 [Fluviicola sp.]